MPTTQISKIQLRRGRASDLPGAPVTLLPLAFSAGLDNGELGFTTDTGRLFVGQVSPTNGTINYQRSDFPYQNVEVLTENTPPEVFQPIIADNRTGFFVSVPLTTTLTNLTLQTLNSSNVAQDFHLDLPVSGVNAIIQYYVFGSTHLAIRQGVLQVVWNSAMVGAPVITDTSVVGTGSLGDLVWTATVVGSNPNKHVVLQYTTTLASPTVQFRLDRPIG